VLFFFPLCFSIFEEYAAKACAGEDDEGGGDVAGFFDATPAAAPKLSLCGTAWRLLTQWVSPQSVRYLHGHDDVALPNSAALVEVRFDEAFRLEVICGFVAMPVAPLNFLCAA
jgi:hypothetical protein